MSLLRSSVSRQFGFLTPCPPALTSYQTLHTSAPICKKYKPQKPFLMPGQTPGQQRAERKRMEAIQKTAKRISSKGLAEQNFVKMRFPVRSRSSTGDADRFGMREGMGRAPVASSYSSGKSWGTREDEEPDRPSSSPPYHLQHNRMDKSRTEARKPFVPRHLRPSNGHQPLNFDDEHEPISPIPGRPERLDFDLTGNTMGVPIAAPRRRNDMDFSSRRSSPSRSGSSSGSFGSSRSGSGSIKRAHNPSPGNSFENQREYTTSASTRQDDGFVVRPSSPSLSTTRTSETKVKGRQTTSLASEIDWRMPSPSEYARYDRMRARAKMGRGGSAGGTSFPRKDGDERRSSRPDRSLTPRPISDKNVVRRDETSRVGERVDDYSRPYRPARSIESGRVLQDARAGSPRACAPFKTSPAYVCTTETLSSSSATTSDDRPASRWAPTKRLSRPAMQGIQDLHRQDPIKYTRAVLSKGFGVSIEAISRILKSDGRWMKREVAEERK